MINMHKKNATLAFILLIILTNVFVKLMILNKLPPDTITFWLDGYYHLGISQIVVDTGYLPENDPFWNIEGVPHVYPDSYEIILSSFRLFGIKATLAANVIMILFSSLSLVAIFIFSNKILKNEMISFFVSLFLLFIPGYFEYSALPIPNTIALFLIPIFLYFLTKFKPNREKIILMGLLGAGTCMLHIMSFEVLFLVFSFYTFLQILIKRNFKEKIREYALIVSLIFLISSGWWIRLHKYGIENLSVKEMDELQMFKHYYWYLSIAVFLAPVGILLGLLRKNTYLPLLIAWIVVNWVFIENYRLDQIFYSKYFTGNLNILRNLLMPNWGQRFFAYMPQPIVISIGLLLAFIREKIKFKDFSIFLLSLIILYFFIFNTYVDQPWFMHLVSDTWLSNTEIEAIRGMKDALPRDSMIVADFPFCEMYFGITGKAAAISPQLRASIPLNSYLDDYIGIYFSQNTTEIKKLALKHGITHIVLSERIKNSGHFATTSSVWPYKLYQGVSNANLEKFNDEQNYKKVYEYKDVEVFEIKF